jgi:uncharacterized protein (DUF952 family)
VCGVARVLVRAAMSQEAVAVAAAARVRTVNETAFRIVLRLEWEEAKATGAYAGSAIDTKDGFLHMSPAGEVRGTLNKYFRGAGEDVLVLVVDLTAIHEPLVVRWESVESRGGVSFPHLYGGPLPVTSVREVVALKRREGGDEDAFDIPAGWGW